jgi:hypothetical protein
VARSVDAPRPIEDLSTSECRLAFQEIEEKNRLREVYSRQWLFCVDDESSSSKDLVIGIESRVVR